MHMSLPGGSSSAEAASGHSSVRCGAPTWRSNQTVGERPGSGDGSSRTSAVGSWLAEAENFLRGEPRRLGMGARF
jgi:hypothetical protein